MKLLPYKRKRCRYFTKYTTADARQVYFNKLVCFFLIGRRMEGMEIENSTSGENPSQPNTESPPRTERRSTRGSRQRGVDSVTKKFLRNFDPEHSEREKRKLHRRLYMGHKRHSLYNECGIYVPTGTDMCDCLNLSCAGCHFPCAKCGSPKCGHECRNNRKWTYESIENEGSDVIIKNPLLKETTS